MTTQEQIKQIAEEAKAKIDALAESALKSADFQAVKDLHRWVPEHYETYLVLNGLGIIDKSRWIGDEADMERQQRGLIAPDTKAGRERLKRVDEWRIMMYEFMTAGDQPPDVKGFVVELCNDGTPLWFSDYRVGAVGQRTFSTPELRDAWVKSVGEKKLLAFLQGGWP